MGKFIIYNLKPLRQQFTRKRGFTLVELLVVMTLFALLLLVINQILFSTFKGASKTEATNKVKREGERVMAVMERSMRNARSIYSCTSTQIAYQDQYGTLGSFGCSNVGSGSGYIASGSASLTSNDVDVTSCAIACENINGSVKAVIITASFAAKGTATSLRSEEQGNVSLQSRIILRN